MDNFHEEVATRKSGKALYGVLYAVVWVMIVFFGLSALMGIQFLFQSFDIASLVMALIEGGLAVLGFIYKDWLRLEYDYTFTNGEMDFAKVFGNARRKHAMTVRIRNIQAAGRVAGNEFNRYASMRGIKKHNFFVNRGADLHFLFFTATKDQIKHLVVFEPSETLAGLVKQYCPRGAFYE